MREVIPEIIHYIKRFVDGASADLNPYVAQSRLNLEFIKGNQNKKIDKKTLRLMDKQYDTQVYTERKIINKMLPIFLARYGILSKNMPIPGIKPGKMDTKNTEDAVKLNAYITDIMKDLNFTKSYKKLIKHVDINQLCWIKTGIDWSDGEHIADVEVTANNTSGTLSIYEGRPFISIVPFYEVFVDNIHAESMEDINELVHRRAFPIDYVYKRWGFEAKEETIYDAKLNSYPKRLNFGQATVGDIKYCYVYEYYKKADALYPNGRYVIICNNKVLWDKELPYKNSLNGIRTIPFDYVTFQSIPNYLIGVSVYSQIIPIQETYNAAKNRYLEYMNHIAIGQMFYWEGSLINKNTFTNTPGKLIGLKRNSKPPQPVQKDKLSNEFIQYTKGLEEDMLITAGLSQMTAFGQTKSNVRTDGVVDKLTESDENKLGNAVDNLCECIIEVFKKLIYLEKEREKILSEKLKVASIDNYTQRYNLSHVDAEQLTIVNREFLIQSDQVFDKKLTQAGNLGILAVDSPLSYIAKLNLLTSLNANYLIDSLDPLQRSTHDLCSDEHLQFKNSKIPEVMPYHLHAQHVYEHDLFRISPEVRALERENASKYKALLEAIENHCKEHQKYLQQTNSQNANAKAALTGTAKKK